MTVRDYLTYALYAALAVCYVMLLWQFLMHKQWKFALLSLVLLPIFWGGFVILLIVGWQEGASWKIKRLMIVYSLLLPLFFVVRVNNAFKSVMEPPPVKKRLPGANR